MSNVDLCGHVFYAFIFGGLVLLSKRNILGWPVRLVGEAGWLGIGIYLNLTSVWAWGAVFVAMDLYGFYTWRKQNA